MRDSMPQTVGAYYSSITELTERDTLARLRADRNMDGHGTANSASSATLIENSSVGSASSRIYKDREGAGESTFQSTMTIGITWEERAERKRQALAAYLADWAPKQDADAVHTGNVLSVPAKVLTEQEVAITEMGPSDLVEALQASKLSSVEVTVSFQFRTMS